MRIASKALTFAYLKLKKFSLTWEYEDSQG